MNDARTSVVTTVIESLRKRHSITVAHLHARSVESLRAQHIVCKQEQRRCVMAKYGKAASKTVESAMRRRKKGTLKSGSGRKVKSRKQAIAIGLSEARKKGAKVPKRKSKKR